MTDNELKHLSRTDLLEMLIAQSSEINELRAELEKANAQLADRTLKVDKAGTLAEAAFAVNDVLAAAQAAADQYLENIRDCELVARQRLQEAEAQAEAILAAAREKAGEA